MKVVLEDVRQSCSPYSIPKGWRMVLLKELSLLRISNGAFNDPKCVGSGYKLINIVDLYQGPTICTANLGRLSLSESEYKTFKVRRGDIFFTRSSLKKEGIAHCNIFFSDEENVVYECHMMRVRPDPAIVDSKYLQEFCLAAPAREYFISHGKTTTMTTIDQGSIGGLPVLLPPLLEQQKIAAVFRVVDDKLAIVDRQLEAMQTLKRGLMQALFTRGVGTQDVHGRWVPHIDFENSELGEIPAGWQVTKLGNEVLSIVGGGTPSKDKAEYWGGDIPWASVKDFVGTRLSQTQDCITPRAVTESATNLIPAGTLITPTRMALGRVAVFDCDVAINQDLKAIFPKPSLANDFLFYWFQLNAERIEAAGTGSTVKGIRLETLREFGVALPPILEQKEIAAILKTVDDKLESLLSRRKHCRALKRGLMQKLLTGEWRFKLDLEALAA